MRINAKKGFTLIELLVVIAIIGLLSSIVMVSLRKARMKARDAQRIENLSQMRTAIESYANDHGKYPPTPYYRNYYSSTDESSWNEFQNLLKPYLSKLPKDPVNNGNPEITGNYSYFYQSNSFLGEYDLITQLENKDNGNRCELKCWRYHSSGSPEASWCKGSPLCGSPSWPNSPYIYADH